MALSSSIANRGSRAGAIAAGFSALALLPIVPHVVEEATLGGLERFGLGTTASLWVIGASLALQLLFAFAALRERRIGYVGVLLIAAGWVVSVLIDHYDAFLAGEFREGLVSRASVWGIVGFQGLAAIASASAVRSTRRTSFSGTGSYG